MSGSSTILKIRNFSVRDRFSREVIIDSSTVSLEAGEIVLLVGMSGSGKSLLCSLLLGSLPAESPALQARGSLLLNGVDLLDLTRAARRERKRLGAVFQLQNLGLFGELSVDENIVYAHRRSVAKERAAHWRVELALSSAGNIVDLLSGGQQQRVAMARTLEARPEVVLYDEPTTGLDPEACRTTVGLIKQYHRSLTLIVTHDYQSFAGVADRVFLIDPVEKKIRDLAGEGVDIESADALRRHISNRARLAAEKKTEKKTTRAGLLAGLLAFFCGGLLPEEARRAKVTPGAWTQLSLIFLAVGLSADRVLVRSAEVISGLAQLPYRLLDRRVRWRYRRSLELFFAPGTILFVAFASALIGLVATYFTFDRLPLKTWTEPIVVDDLLKALGFAILRVLAPLLTAILLAAKVGARVAATTGSLQRGRQIDAMRIAGVHPTHALLLPAVVSYALGFLFLVGVAAVTASAVSLFVFIHGHHHLTPKFWWGHYTRHLTAVNVAWVASKTLISAVGAAVIAHDSGMLPKRSAQDLGRGIHRTVLLAMIWVLTVHAAFSFVEFPRVV